MGLLEGKKVLVTGARKGIGRGIAYAVAREGADVGINDYIDDEETQKTVKLVESFGRLASKHIGDVSKKKNIKAYKHPGFWQCMDTKRDKDLLDQIIKNKKYKI